VRAFADAMEVIVVLRRPHIVFHSRICLLYDVGFVVSWHVSRGSSLNVINNGCLQTGPMKFFSEILRALMPFTTILFHQVSLFYEGVLHLSVVLTRYTTAFLCR
jgi:hypothetical protein